MASDKSKDPSNEKRIHPRWIIENSVMFQRESNPNSHEALSQNLSCSGISMLTTEKLHPGQKIHLHITLSDTESIDLTGKVMWIRRHGDRHRVGIHFVGIVEEEQTRILKFAFDVKHDNVVNHWFKDWNSWSLRPFHGKAYKSLQKFPKKFVRDVRKHPFPRPAARPQFPHATNLRAMRSKSSCVVS